MEKETSLGLGDIIAIAMVIIVGSIGLFTVMDEYSERQKRVKNHEMTCTVNGFYIYKGHVVLIKHLDENRLSFEDTQTKQYYVGSHEEIGGLIQKLKNSDELR